MHDAAGGCVHSLHGCHHVVCDDEYATMQYLDGLLERRYGRS